MEDRRRRRAAEALALRLSLAALIALVPAIASAHEQPELDALGCAGDGAPPGSGWPRRWLALTGILSGQGLLAGGRDLNVYSGDAVDGDGFQARLIRFGLCGRVPLKLGSLSWAVVYEPWSALEARRVDRYGWGRFAVAELGWQPLDWLGAYLGIRKVRFDFGGDEPEQQRALPLLPALTLGVAPDRRLGLTADVDFGAVRLIAGAYESARQLGDLAHAGILVAGRGLIEPLGPVGAALSTLDDGPFWQKRARFALDLSFQYEWTPAGSGWSFGGDLPFKWGPLGFVVEYLYASTLPEERPTFLPAPRTSRMGLFAQAALMLWRPYLELELRYEWNQRPLVEDPRGSFHGLTYGLTVYAWRTWVKLQLAGSHRIHYAGVNADDDVGLLVVTLAR